MSRLEIPCRIVRCAEQQGTRPSVGCQAEVEKYATGCGKMSLPSKHLERQTNSKIHQVRSMFNLPYRDYQCTNSKRRDETS